MLLGKEAVGRSKVDERYKQFSRVKQHAACCKASMASHDACFSLSERRIVHTELSTDNSLMCLILHSLHYFEHDTCNFMVLLVRTFILLSQLFILVTYPLNRHTLGHVRDECGFYLFSISIYQHAFLLFCYWRDFVLMLNFIYYFV